MTDEELNRQIKVLSDWLDEANAHRDPEARTWGRLAKLSEEAGEVIEAFIGVTGQNPRKGTNRSLDNVRKELLDVAMTALQAHYHLFQGQPSPMEDLRQHSLNLLKRIGLE